MKSKVIDAVGWNAVAKLISTGLAFLAIPIFTHLLSTSDYGSYAFYMSWLGILLPLVTGGLHLSIARAKIEFKVDYSKYVSSVILLVTIFFIIDFFLVLIFGNQLEMLLSLDYWTILILICHAYFYALFLIGVEFFRYQGQYKKSAFFEILQPILIMVLGVVFVTYYFTDSAYFSRVLGTVIPMSILGALLLYVVVREGKTAYSKKYWKYGASFSLPLIPGAIAFIMNAQLDKILITKILSVHETGIYSFAYTVGMIVMLAGNAIKQAINPWIFQYMESGKEQEALNLNLYFAKFMMLASIVLLYISPELIHIISPKEYYGGVTILNWIILGGFFQQLMTIEVTNVMFLKKSQWYSVVTVIGIISNLLLNLAFIPDYGIMGAAFTTAISCFLMFSFLLVINRKVLHFSSFKLKWYGTLIAINFLFFVLFEFIENDFQLRCAVLIAFFSLFFIYHKKEINNLFIK